MKKACENAGRKYTISANWELSYTDSVKMATQFPTRDSSNNREIGTFIGGSSNMSSTPEAAVYSKNVAKLMGKDEQQNDIEVTWEMNQPYYCMINTNAKLTLNSDDADNPNGEFYQLGINENDIDEGSTSEIGEGSNKKTVYGPIKMNAIYDVSDLSAAGDVESMKLTFTVRKKPDYTNPLTFEEYIDGLTLYAYNAGDNTQNAETEAVYSVLEAGADVTIDTTTDIEKIVYTVNHPEQVFHYDADNKIYQIPITLNAIIGDAFGNSKQYANYMVSLEIAMYSNADDLANSYIDGSKDDDHVIYTHAKLLTNVIE